MSICGCLVVLYVNLWLSGGTICQYVTVWWYYMIFCGNLMVLYVILVLSGGTICHFGSVWW